MMIIVSRKWYGWGMREAVLDADDVIMYLEQDVNLKKA